jgi:hypothetical protein
MRNVDEQELRSYLLGRLPPERQTELHALVREDAELREELLAVEAELFDQYAGDLLVNGENELFESHVLTGSGAVDKLRFAENFGRFRHTHEIDGPPVVSNGSPAHSAPAPDIAYAPRSAPLFAHFNRNPAFTVVLIVVAGLLITLLGWLLLTKTPASNLARQSSPAVVEFALAPGSMRSDGGMQHLPAPAKNVRVNIELELAKSDYKRYQTQLFRENQAVESQNELTSQPRNAHYVVPVLVTGEMLTPGDYQLKLSGVADSGIAAFIESYSFRVTPEPPGNSKSDGERGNLTR